MVALKFAFFAEEPCNPSSWDAEFEIPLSNPVAAASQPHLQVQLLLYIMGGPPSEEPGLCVGKNFCSFLPRSFVASVENFEFERSANAIPSS